MCGKEPVKAAGDCPESAHSGLCDLKKTVFCMSAGLRNQPFEFKKITLRTTAFHIADIEITLLVARNI